MIHIGEDVIGHEDANKEEEEVMVEVVEETAAVSPSSSSSSPQPAQQEEKQQEGQASSSSTTTMTSMEPSFPAEADVVVVVQEEEEKEEEHQYMEDQVIEVDEKEGNSPAITEDMEKEGLVEEGEADEEEEEQQAAIESLILMTASVDDVREVSSEGEVIDVKDRDESEENGAREQDSSPTITASHVETVVLAHEENEDGDEPMEGQSEEGIRGEEKRSFGTFRGEQTVVVYEQEGPLEESGDAITQGEKGRFFTSYRGETTVVLPSQSHHGERIKTLVVYEQEGPMEGGGGAAAAAIGSQTHGDGLSLCRGGKAVVLPSFGWDEKEEDEDGDFIPSLVCGHRAINSGAALCLWKGKKVEKQISAVCPMCSIATTTPRPFPRPITPAYTPL